VAQQIPALLIRDGQTFSTESHIENYRGPHILHYTRPRGGRAYITHFYRSPHILHNSHLRLSKNAVSNEMCEIKSRKL